MYSVTCLVCNDSGHQAQSFCLYCVYLKVKKNKYEQNIVWKTKVYKYKTNHKRNRRKYKIIKTLISKKHPNYITSHNVVSYKWLEQLLWNLEFIVIL
jgi:hypothetical protein